MSGIKAFFKPAGRSTSSTNGNGTGRSEQITPTTSRKRPRSVIINSDSSDEESTDSKVLIPPYPDPLSTTPYRGPPWKLVMESHPRERRIKSHWI